ncbi:MAG TPA: sugar porter family MFS transporter [Niabella sp.]|nr:sugar porter family MFS transporter [Niabella sp.]HQW13468.1 sugar porter family MFS transporter [Niabella sp.]HQX18862.1 sugar porter family MFS transporter [Niabella sp.]HQX41932.1 sugar porter family MFS transporter [Niabella sp.]HRB27156.1 sugar porter family MFS transporter [Niabella sp.]
MERNQHKINQGYIIAISFISALGGYLFGFDFAVIAGALPFLKEQFAFNEYWEGFATASLALGCVVGCFIAGALSDKYGRKPGLMLAAFLFFISSLAMAFSSTRDIFILARFVAGIGVGMASMLSPLYIAEVAPANTRGRMVAINQLTIVIGILITNLVNYTLRNSGPDAWRLMVGFGAIPSGLFLLGVIWLPESPRWLLKEGKDSQAVAVLNKIGSVNYVAETLSGIKGSLNASNVKFNYSGVFKKAVFPAVAIGIGLAVFQQFCGINVVFNFTTTIFESVGFSKDDQLKQTVFIGIINLIFTLLAMWQVDKLGRKPLMIIGSLSLAVLYIISGLLLQNKSPLAAWPLLAAIGMFAMTLGPVTWVLISEIFPTHIRGAATSIAVISLWLSYALLVFTFPILASKLGAYTPFYIYAGICVLGFWFINSRVKETKGKSLEDLENVFRGH